VDENRLADMQFDLILFSCFQMGNGTVSTSVLEESDFSEEADLSKSNHKTFFRRLSFKGLRKGKVKLKVITTAADGHRLCFHTLGHTH
jgi:hypothetical protein